MRGIKTIYCDFDGTVTKKDAVNTFFDQFAPEKWKESEKLWVDGKISSRENAIIQVGLLPEISETELNNFIDKIEVDDYFVQFVKFLKTKNIKLVILSDGFDLFIKKVLKRLNVDDLEVYANHIIYENNKLSIEFPYYNSSCDIGAGMCKCNRIKEKEFCYIGDGTSDLCVAKKAKYLFASKVLKKHCEDNLIKHYPFKSFRDIINFVKENW